MTVWSLKKSRLEDGLERASAGRRRTLTQVLEFFDWFDTKYVIFKTIITKKKNKQTKNSSHSFVQWILVDQSCIRRSRAQSKIQFLEIRICPSITSVCILFSKKKNIVKSILKRSVCLNLQKCRFLSNFCLLVKKNSRYMFQTWRF